MGFLLQVQYSSAINFFIYRLGLYIKRNREVKTIGQTIGREGNILEPKSSDPQFNDQIRGQSVSFLNKQRCPKALYLWRHCQFTKNIGNQRQVGAEAFHFVLLERTSSQL